MPSPPNELRANGNYFGGIRVGYGGKFLHVDGRGNGNLPIYILPFDALLGLMGGPTGALYKTMKNPDEHVQKTFHRDDDQNLPELPPGDGYPELHIPANGLPYPKYLRLVIDQAGQRVFLTPTHYENWNDGGAARNPFFLIKGGLVPKFGYIKDPTLG
jgi:hypothetical protein